MTWLDGSIRSEDLQELAEHLRRIPKVSQTVGRDDADEDSWAIAHGLKGHRRGQQTPSIRIGATARST